MSFSNSSPPRSRTLGSGGSLVMVGQETRGAGKTQPLWPHRRQARASWRQDETNSATWAVITAFGRRRQRESVCDTGKRLRVAILIRARAPGSSGTQEVSRDRVRFFVCFGRICGQIRAVEKTSLVVAEVLLTHTPVLFREAVRRAAELQVGR